MCIRESAFVGMAMSPGWILRASQLSKDSICVDLTGKAGQKVPFHYPSRKKDIFNF